MGSGPQSRPTSYSTAKSMTSTLVGAALHDGAIGSLDDRCGLYLPRLRGSAYEGVTVRNACACALAWPGARNTTDSPKSGACIGPWRAGGQGDVGRFGQLVLGGRRGVQ